MATHTLICIDCGRAFERQNPQGRLPIRCPECGEIRKKLRDREKSKRWQEAHPERAREMWNKHNRKRLADPEFRRRAREQFVLRTYGLTPEQLQVMLDKATGCAVCGGPPNGPGKRYHIDHCHGSGRIRGLLCAKCNTMIGLSNDNPETLEKAAAYLRT